MSALLSPAFHPRSVMLRKSNSSWVHPWWPIFGLLLTHELVSHARFASSLMLFVPRSFFQHNGVPFGGNLCARLSPERLLFPHLRAFDTKRSSSIYILFSYCHFVCAEVAEKVKPLDRSFCSRRNFGLLLNSRPFFLYDPYNVVELVRSKYWEQNIECIILLNMPKGRQHFSIDFERGGVELLTCVKCRPRFFL